MAKLDVNNVYKYCDISHALISFARIDMFIWNHSFECAPKISIFSVYLG